MSEINMKDDMEIELIKTGEELRLMRLGIIPVIQSRTPEINYSNTMVLPIRAFEFASGPLCQIEYPKLKSLFT